MPRRRWEAILRAVERLFAERPAYHDRRVDQITCAIAMRFLPPDFPSGEEELPKDAEVEAVLAGLRDAA